MSNITHKETACFVIFLSYVHQGNLYCKPILNQTKLSFIKFSFFWDPFAESPFDWNTDAA